MSCEPQAAGSHDQILEIFKSTRQVFIAMLEDGCQYCTLTCSPTNVFLLPVKCLQSCIQWSQE